jgi:hypothetical protein
VEPSSPPGGVPKKREVPERKAPLAERPMHNTQADIELARGFVRHLEEAETIYRRLLGLTRNQSEVLRGGISPELLDLARAKEEEMARLGELEPRLAPARSAWTGLRERVTGDLRAEVQGVMARVEAVLRELLSLEEVEGRNLAAQREETLAQIRRIDSARRVRGAYSRPAGGPSLLDQKE